MIEAKLQYLPVTDALRRAAEAMTNTKPMMMSISGIMLDAVEENFKEEGRPRWKDLAPSTKLARYVNGKDWKALRGGGSLSMRVRDPGRILQRSGGGLAASIVQQWTSDSAVVGSNKVYAAIHQFGGKTKPHVIRAKHARALSFGGIVVRSVNHPGSNIPARPFLKLTPSDLRSIVVSAGHHYAQALSREAL